MVQITAGSYADPAAALADAITTLGGQAALGRLVGVAQPTVWRWVKARKPLPAEHVLAVETATGISRHDLNPDIYPRDSLDTDRAGLEPAR